MKITPAETFTKSLLNAIDELYKTLDKQLSVQIKTAGDDIESITEAYETTLNDILTYVAFGLSILNTAVLAVIVYVTVKTKHPEPQPRKCTTCQKPTRHRKRHPAAPLESIELQSLNS